MAEGILVERLREWAETRGYGLAIAGIGVVEAVRQKLEKRLAAGMIDATFYRENLTKFRFLEGITVTGPSCVVMVAVPSPISVLQVIVNGRKTNALIPPTYVRYSARFVEVLDDMKENVLGPKAEAETLKAPLKSLAVHMGLVSYGRNNVTYVPGLGSGYQLCGYLVGTGAERMEGCIDAEGRESFLNRCAICRACVEICPTGAIREDRFLISAERCFTLHSEVQKPLPDGIKPPKRICLIGCMDCQQVCPENKGRLKNVPAGVEFTAEETESLIEAGRRMMAEGSDLGGGKKKAESPAMASIRAKLERLGMAEDLEVMGRNLEYFMSRR